MRHLNDFPDNKVPTLNHSLFIKINNKTINVVIEMTIAIELLIIK